jgi:Secretion system C-terminal sorting domain
LTVTDIKNVCNLPTSYSLMQNYPNPFNPTTTINFSVPKTSYVTIKIYDVLGREVAMIVNENKLTGNYSVQFNASKLVSGVYFYKMQAGDFSQTKKLILVK